MGDCRQRILCLRVFTLVMFYGGDLKTSGIEAQFKPLPHIAHIPVGPMAAKIETYFEASPHFRAT
jgi:hypothetical protein